MNRNKMIKLEDNYLGLRISDGAGIYLIAFVFLYIAQVIIIAIASLAHLSKEGLTINYIVMAANQIVFFCAPLLYGKIFSREMLTPSRIKSGLNLKQSIIMPFVAVACILAFLPLSEGFVKLIELTGYSYTPGLPLADPARWWTLPLSIFFVALLPAIGEEFLFRGSVARALKTKSYGYAMIMSALLFSVFHGNAMQLVHQFFLGLVMCFCYFVTGSLFAPMIIHFLNNAISLIVLYIQGLNALQGKPAFTPPVGIQVAIYIAMFVVGIALLIGLLVALTREGKKKQGIAVDKLNAANFFRYFGRAFYPKGIKSNYRQLSATMKTLYNDPVDNVPVVEKPVDEHLDVEDEKLRQMLKDADIEVEKKRKRTDRTAVLLAFGIALFAWLINFVMAYIK